MDQLASMRGIANGPFFGGVGLTADGTQFAMIMADTLYFVVDDTTRPTYDKMGSKCFVYDTRTKRIAVRKYYSVSAELVEDQEHLIALAKESIRVASATKKTARKRSSPSRAKS